MRDHLDETMRPTSVHFSSAQILEVTKYEGPNIMHHCLNVALRVTSAAEDESISFEGSDTWCVEGSYDTLVLFNHSVQF